MLWCPWLLETKGLWLVSMFLEGEVHSLIKIVIHNSGGKVKH